MPWGLFKMKQVFIFFMLLFGFVFQLEAKPVPFSEIQKFHEDRAQEILKNYGLSNKLDLSVLISPRSKESLNIEDKKKVQIRIPGILLGGIQEEEGPEQTIGIFEIVDSLKYYKREVSVIKKAKVSDEEMAALQSGIREFLSLQADEEIKVKDNIFNFTEAMKNWQSDFKESIYTSLFKSSYWIWIPVALLTLFLGAFLISLTFRKSFKGLGESIEKSSAAQESAAFSGRGDIFDEGESGESDYEDLVETEVESNFGADMEQVVAKIFKLYDKSKYELFNILWSQFPTEGKQIAFYEALVNATDPSLETKINAFFFEVFKIKSFHNINFGKEALNPSEFSKLNKSLIYALLVEHNEKREKALSAIFPTYGDSLQGLIKSTVENFFQVVYFIFPDSVTKIIEKDQEMAKKLSSQIITMMSQPKENVEPQDIEIQKFINYVKSGDFKENEEVKLDSNIKALIKNLPDSEIFNSSIWPENIRKQIMKELPNINWIDTSDFARLKPFLLSLSDEEALYLSREYPNYDELFQALDERGQIRFNEKMQRANHDAKEVRIAHFRAKIKKFFVYKERNNVEDFAAGNVFEAA